MAGHRRFNESRKGKTPHDGIIGANSKIIMVSADYFAWQFIKYFNYTVFYFEFLTHVNGDN